MKYISHSLKLKTCIETLDICLFFPTTNLFLHLSEALLEGKKKKVSGQVRKTFLHSRKHSALGRREEEPGETKDG